MANDLFGLAVEITPASFSATYCSGGSAFYDAKGTLEAGRQLGVVADEMPLATRHLIRNYAEQGGRTFIDSGAFGAFKRNIPADFESILAIYDEILAGLSYSARQNIAIVMPDVIGDQTASLGLLQQYRKRIEGYIASGADVIIPVHKGAIPVHQIAMVMTSMFGTNFRLGIPSNAAALADDELAQFKHGKFHILGKATIDAKLRRRAYTLLESNPGADLTCDANLIRTHMGEVTKLHQALIGECNNPFDEVFDDTELIYEVINTKCWLKKSEIAMLASIYGQSDRVSVERWVKAHRETGLEDLIEDVDPDGCILFMYLRSIFNDSAKAMLSARLRSKAVAGVLAA